MLRRKSSSAVAPGLLIDLGKDEPFGPEIFFLQRQGNRPARSSADMAIAFLSHPEGPSEDPLFQRGALFDGFHHPGVPFFKQPGDAGEEGGLDLQEALGDGVGAFRIGDGSAGCHGSKLIDRPFEDEGQGKEREGMYRDG